MAVGYINRDKILSKIGYSSYGEYMQSELFTGIKDRFLSKNKVCYGCSGQSDSIYYSDFTDGNLSGYSDGGMVAMCSSCKRRIEFRRGLDLTHQQSNKMMLYLFKNPRQKSKAKKKSSEKTIRKLERQRKMNERFAERNKGLF